MVDIADPHLRPIEVTSEDTPKPETNPKYPRLYGHLLCPFVEKARIALAAKNVHY
jgi:hypothetical protein